MTVQAHCYRCRAPAAVPDGAREFTCPHCGAVNVSQAPPPAPPTSSGFGPGLVVFALCIVSAVASWIAWPVGLGAGAVFVVWGATALTGKVRSPIEFLLPQSGGGSALAAATVVLGLVALIFGTVGMFSSRKYKAEQAVLRAEALEIVPEYTAELDRIEAMINGADGDRETLQEARRALSKAHDIAKPHLRMRRVPDELARQEERRIALRKRVDPPSPEECRAVKQTMLDACLPGCTADPDLVGEAFDECLRACARKKFSKELPMCTR